MNNVLPGYNIEVGLGGTSHQKQLSWWLYTVYNLVKEKYVEKMEKADKRLGH